MNDAISAMNLRIGVLVERSKIVLRSKNYWMLRAVRAEADLRESEEVRLAYAAVIKAMTATQRATTAQLVEKNAELRALRRVLRAARAVAGVVPRIRLNKYDDAWRELDAALDEAKR